MLRKKGRLVSSRHSTKLTPQQLKERYLARAATKLGVVDVLGECMEKDDFSLLFFCKLSFLWWCQTPAF